MGFAEKLMQLRKSRGLSQEDLAERLGVSRQAVSRWEQGNTFPDLPNLQRLVKVFGVSADYMICDESTESVQPEMVTAEVRENSQMKFDFRGNRFLLVGFMWLFAAVCFLITAMFTLNILFVGLTLADVLLACMNFELHFRGKK